MRAPTVVRAAESTASLGPEAAGRSTVDAAEIARFAAMAEEWWDPAGKFRPLHQLNPIRIGFIRDQVAARFRRDITVPRPFAGLRLLDIGCGGGLLAEPMTRLGADVVGVDAAEQNIHIARQHALAGGLAVDYRHDRAEALAARGERFDIVLAMEVVEHVADVEAFLTACSTMLKPGGIMVLATLNRTPKSFALAIVGAEYVMRWLPRGTHTWSKFIRPHEMARGLRHAGLSLDLLAGMQYRPLAGTWSIGHDLEVNYLALASKPAPDRHDRA